MTASASLIHHRSKNRIQNLGEVFTPEKYVEITLDILTRHADPNFFWADENKIFFEPSCGSGNFILGVLERRLNAFYLKANQLNINDASLYSIANSINTIWAIDIDKKNINECRQRILDLIFKFLELKSKHNSVQSIVSSNPEFFSHVICAIKWQVHENEAISAVCDSKNSLNIKRTKISRKWNSAKKNKQIDFDLSWVEYFRKSLELKYKVIDYERVFNFLMNPTEQNLRKLSDDFKFMKIISSSRI